VRGRVREREGGKRRSRRKRRDRRKKRGVKGKDQRWSSYA
jgi:hypothetical protein